MITKTASELVHGAEVKAGVYNIDFMDYLTLTNELNNAYREVYSEVADSDSDYFIKHAIFEENHFPLPRDIFKIKSVNFVNRDGSWSPIERQPPKQFVHGCYYIEDNTFHYNGDAVLPIMIRYVPVPQTITCPREAESIDLDSSSITEYGKMTDKGFYFKRDDQFYYYSFEDLAEEEIEEDDYKSQPNTFLHHTLDVDLEEQTVTATDRWGNEEDWSDILIPDKENQLTAVALHSPYMMTSYEEGEILVWNGLQTTRWNIKASTGHETIGTIHALHTNDRTLFGCLYEDDEGYLWRASFVPDTVLNYPSNALFNYLEVILARLLLSMNGLENPYIQKELYEQVRFQFRKELNQNSGPVRVRNTLRRTLHGLG